MRSQSPDRHLSHSAIRACLSIQLGLWTKHIEVIEVAESCAASKEGHSRLQVWAKAFGFMCQKLRQKFTAIKKATDVDTQLLFGRHPVPRRQAYIYIYNYIYLQLYLYIYIIVNTHVFRWCGIISWPGVTALQTKPIACQPTISQTSLLGRRPAVRRKPLNPGAGHGARVLAGGLQW